MGQWIYAKQFKYPANAILDNSWSESLSLYAIRGLIYWFNDSSIKPIQNTRIGDYIRRIYSWSESQIHTGVGNARLKYKKIFIRALRAEFRNSYCFGSRISFRASTANYPRWRNIVNVLTEVPSLFRKINFARASYGWMCVCTRCKFTRRRQLMGYLRCKRNMNGNKCTSKFT